MPASSPKHQFAIHEEDAGKRLDQFLVTQLGSESSRARLQQLIREAQVQVNGAPAKAAVRLRVGDQITVLGAARSQPLRAVAEDIPLDIVYEDADMAVVNKPAGMMVHAGAGSAEDDRNRGTLVNALLHRFGKLSGGSGELRPGIVHRLDKDTSGLIVVAKNDAAHRKLGEQFSFRQVKKKYLALVHGSMKSDQGTIAEAISRDRIRRTRMTTRRQSGREAKSHYRVLKRLDSSYGKFSLLEVAIETGRTHQIRVHLSSIGHPVVGDALYGAPREIVLKPASPGKASAEKNSAALRRNFLHAAAIELLHPRTGAPLAFSRPLPQELEEFLARLQGSTSATV